MRPRIGRSTKSLSFRWPWRASQFLRESLSTPVGRRTRINFLWLYWKSQVHSWRKLCGLSRDAIPQPHLILQCLPIRGAHARLFFQSKEGDGQRQCMSGYASNTRCKGPFRLARKKLRYGLHVAGKRMGIAIAESPGLLDRHIAQGIEHIGRDLRTALVGKNEANVHFSGLIEQRGDVCIICDVVVTLVDVAEGCFALLSGEGSTLLSALQEHGNEEAAEHLGSLVLEEVLVRVDEYDLG